MKKTVRFKKGDFVFYFTEGKTVKTKVLKTSPMYKQVFIETNKEKHWVKFDLVGSTRLEALIKRHINSNYVSYKTSRIKKEITDLKKHVRRLESIEGKILNELRKIK